MICPKCGFEQRENVECARCGIVISRYKGPVLGSPAPRPAVPPPPPAASSGYNTVPTFAPPAPPSASPPPMPGLSYAEQAVWRETNAPRPSSPAMYGGEATADGTLFNGTIPPPRPPGAGTVYTGAAVPGMRVQNRATATFTSGRLVSETFKIYFVNIIPFVILTMFALAPVFVFSAWVSTLDPRAPLAMMGEGLAQILTFLLAPIATAGINYGVFQQMRGGNPSLGDCLRVGFASLLPVLGLASSGLFLSRFDRLVYLVGGIVVAGSIAVVIAVRMRARPR